MSPSEHERVCEPAGPLREQAEAVWDAMVQVTPAREGSGSLTVTAVAVPGPLLDTVMVKPTGLPAVTGVASAVLVIARPGPLTTMVAKACTEAPLVDEAVAVLGSEPLVSGVVGLMMWML